MTDRSFNVQQPRRSPTNHSSSNPLGSVSDPVAHPILPRSPGIDLIGRDMTLPRRAAVSSATGSARRVRPLPNPRHAMHPDDMPDPFVLAFEGKWYAYATGNVSQGDAPTGRALKLFVSDDFVHWKSLPAPLVAPDDAGNRSFWAPEIVRGDDGRFYLYYSYGHEGQQRHRLRVAVADTPEGPFHDACVDLVNPDEQQFVIDPHPFRDDDGTWWLFYARNFLDHGPDFHAGTGLVVDRLDTMTCLAGSPTTVLRAGSDWTLFEANRDLPCYGAKFDWHTLEGAFVRKHAGRYWMMYSGGNYTGPDYGVGVASSDHPAGPYTGDFRQPALLSRSHTGLCGPGHHSITTGPDGRDWIAFHAWNDAMTCRQMHLGPIRWTDAGPVRDW